MHHESRVPSIDICSLGIAREADLTLYDGVITIEDSTVEKPFRIETTHPPQRIIVFDDITSPIDDYVVLEEWQVRSALSFARQFECPSLLIHCHAGMSRSPAIALAILADFLGKGKEEKAVRELLKVVSLCTPNRFVLETADRVLAREGRLVEACDKVL